MSTPDQATVVRLKGFFWSRVVTEAAIAPDPDPDANAQVPSPASPALDRLDQRLPGSRACALASGWRIDRSRFDAAVDELTRMGVNHDLAKVMMFELSREAAERNKALSGDNLCKWVALDLHASLPGMDVEVTTLVDALQEALAVALRAGLLAERKGP